MRCTTTVQRRLAGLRAADQGKQGPIAQLVERLAGSQKVRGSNPLGSTKRVRWSNGVFATLSLRCNDPLGLTKGQGRGNGSRWAS